MKTIKFKKTFLVAMTICLCLSATKQVKAETYDLSKITVKNAIATGYCLKGTTATGTQTKEGVIAYMPEYFGYTMMVFEDVKGDGITIDPTAYIGTYVCSDTGSEKIRKGWVCDIWFPDYASAKEFGSKKVIILAIPSEG